MAQLQQHWMYGLDAPKYNHTAHLKLPKGPLDAASRSYLPTPTLQDLLNPATDEEVEALLNNPDPYGLEELTDDDNDDNECEIIAPVVTRGAQRLEIDDIVDLSQPKLLARYDGKTMPGNRKSSKVTQKVGEKAAQWAPEKFSMEELEF